MKLRRNIRKQVQILEGNEVPYHLKNQEKREREEMEGQEGKCKGMELQQKR